MEHIFQNISLDAKKSLIAMLIILSEADGQYDDNEIALIKDTGLKMGLSLDEIKAVKKKPNSFRFELPDNMKERIQMFYYLLFMIRIDGKITIREKDVLKKVGFHLCLNPDLMNEMLDVLEKFKNQPIPDNIMAEKVKKYLN